MSHWSPGLKDSCRALGLSLALQILIVVSSQNKGVLGCQSLQCRIMFSPCIFTLHLMISIDLWHPPQHFFWDPFPNCITKRFGNPYENMSFSNIDNSANPMKHIFQIWTIFENPMKNKLSNIDNLSNPMKHIFSILTPCFRFLIKSFPEILGELISGKF